MKRVIATAMGLVLVLTMAACGKKAEDTSTITVTGMVTAINGSVISLVEMDSNRLGSGTRPSMPENMEGFENFEGFEGGKNPWGEGEMPDFGEGQMPQRPQNGERPDMPTGEDGEFSGFTPFGDGQMPNFEGGEIPNFDGSKMPDMGNFEIDGEVTEIDIGNAHITVEEDGVKATGSLSDLKVGSFVTITKNEKGEVTNVLITASSGFNGMGGFGNFGDRGNRPTKGEQPTE